MLALAASLSCAAFASVGALLRLRAVCLATHYDLEPLGKLVGTIEDRASMASTLPCYEAGQNGWEADLVRTVCEARTSHEAMMMANEVLLDLDSTLGWGAHLPGICARIAVFGALIGVALVLSSGAAMSTELVDVIAVGGAGMLVATSCGAQSRKVADLQRRKIDRFVDALFRSCGFGDARSIGQVAAAGAAGNRRVH